VHWYSSDEERANGSLYIQHEFHRTQEVDIKLLLEKLEYFSKNSWRGYHTTIEAKEKTNLLYANTCETTESLDLRNNKITIFLPPRNGEPHPLAGLQFLDKLSSLARKIENKFTSSNSRNLNTQIDAENHDAPIYHNRSPNTPADSQQYPPHPITISTQVDLFTDHNPNQNPTPLQETASPDTLFIVENPPTENAPGRLEAHVNIGYVISNLTQ
jgi:hypothetical protein